MRSVSRPEDPQWAARCELNEQIGKIDTTIAKWTEAQIRALLGELECVHDTRVNTERFSVEQAKIYIIDLATTDEVSRTWILNRIRDEPLGDREDDAITPLEVNRA